jgi:AraC-like DNA-binding protein
LIRQRNRAHIWPGMARITPLWDSPELSLHRFDHPVEHEDRPYEEVADAYQASFVETGTFDLEVDEGRWRVKAGDIMLSHPDMRFRAGFTGAGFNDTCLTLTYLAARNEGFDGARNWARAGAPVRPGSNHIRYLRWGLERALALGAPMFIEYCAAMVFHSRDGDDGARLFSERKFGWYAERVDFARERIGYRFADELTVSELARAAGMSMFHFIRIFTALVGTPPHRYLLETRLGAARAMLADGRSVTETCYACGFGDLSHFSRSFARRFGAPPSAFIA